MSTKQAGFYIIHAHLVTGEQCYYHYVAESLAEKRFIIGVPTSHMNDPPLQTTSQRLAAKCSLRLIL